jgi:hypothetical protein
MEGMEGGVRAFGSPTVLHFCAVLLLAAIHTIPGHTVTSLALCLRLVAVAGLVLSVRVVVQARRQQSYAPVLSDWIWHATLPFFAYAALLVAAFGLPWRPATALDVAAAVTLLLLFIGIHNAWDSVVWIAANRSGRSRPG